MDEYSQRIRDAVPILIEEYNAEAINNTEGLQGLATLSNEKISELAEISNEGISKMAEYYYHAGSGSYDEYEEWAGKLMDVYMEEATKFKTHIWIQQCNQRYNTGLVNRSPRYLI